MDKKLNILRGKKGLIFLGLLSFILILVLYSQGLILAATVNNQPITRLKLIRELEKQGGQQVLDRLINATLIMQEAKKQGVVVSQEEVDRAVDEIRQNVESKGISFEEALSFQGKTVEDLKQDILVQRIVEQILGPKIQISDEEAAQYFENNQESFAEETKLEDVQEQIKDALFQQKLAEEYQLWISQLQQEAKIKYFVSF